MEPMTEIERALAHVDARRVTRDWSEDKAAGAVLAAAYRAKVEEVERLKAEIKRLAPVKSHNGKDLLELWEAAEARVRELEERLPNLFTRMQYEKLEATIRAQASEIERLTGLESVGAKNALRRIEAERAALAQEVERLKADILRLLDEQCGSSCVKAHWRAEKAEQENETIKKWAEAQHDADGEAIRALGRSFDKVRAERDALAQENERLKVDLDGERHLYREVQGLFHGEQELRRLDNEKAEQENAALKLQAEADLKVWDDRAEAFCEKWRLAEQQRDALAAALKPFAEAHENHEQGLVTLHDFRVAHDALSTLPQATPPATPDDCLACGQPDSAHVGDAEDGGYCPDHPPAKEDAR